MVADSFTKPPPPNHKKAFYGPAVGYNIWKLTRSCSFFTTLKLKKVIAESRLFLAIVYPSIFYVIRP